MSTRRTTESGTRGVTSLFPLPTDETLRDYKKPQRPSEGPPYHPPLVPRRGFTVSWGRRRTSLGQRLAWGDPWGSSRYDRTDVSWVLRGPVVDRTGSFSDLDAFTLILRRGRKRPVQHPSLAVSGGSYRWMVPGQPFRDTRESGGPEPGPTRRKDQR